MFPIHSETYFSPSWKTCWCWWIKGAPYSRTKLFCSFHRLPVSIQRGFCLFGLCSLMPWLLAAQLANICTNVLLLGSQVWLPCCISFCLHIHVWNECIFGTIHLTATSNIQWHFQWTNIICTRYILPNVNMTYSIFSAKQFSDIRKDISKCTNVDIFILKCFCKLVERLIEKSLKIS